MDKLIYTAVSGAERVMRAERVHANNLANMDTTGFRANFELATAAALMNGYGQGYDDRHMAKIESDSISTRAGNVRETGRALDVALDGKGYLAVQFGDGEAYTRAGNISIDANGALSVQGRALLGEGGPIVLPAHTAVEIARDGTISVKTEGSNQLQVVDRLRIVNGEASQLTKNEAGLVVLRGGGQLDADPALTVRSRALEGSNVSAVEEMVATMSLTRQFEMQMKLFKASDDMNEVGNRLLGA